MAHRFHPGERAVQRRTGVADMADRIGTGIHAAIPPRAAEFLAAQRFIVLGSEDGDRRVWASIVHGRPGFLRIAGEEILEIDAQPLPGDPLAVNLVAGAPLGALVIEPATRRRVRINGIVAQAAAPIRLAVEEFFGNCPKYIQRRELAVGAAVMPAAPLAASALSTAQREWLARTDTFFVATRHAAAGLDVSHRGGAPGFVEVVDDRHLAWPDYSGNMMFQTLGNLTLDPHAGIVVVDFARGDVLQCTGTAQVDFDAARAARHPGAERMVDFAIDAVRETAGGFPLRAGAVEPSPFNP